MTFKNSQIPLRSTSEITASDTRGICVLFGALRSGTTMLRLMIDRHPQLICPGETDFLTDYLIRTPDGGWRYDLEALASDRIFQDSRAHLPKTTEAGPTFQSMLQDLRGDQPGLVVLVLHRGLERLLDLAPDISILHLVRDPRDVARSTIGMGWTGHVYFGARFWIQTEEEWERAAPRVGKNQNLELRYEPLVRTPETVLKEICSFLGEQYDSDMLNYAGQSTYDSPDPSLTEQWRKKLSERELRLIEPLFGDLLPRRGYTLSGLPPLKPGLAERLILWLKNKRTVWSFRIAKYGLHDPLIVALARNVRMPYLAVSARRRMQAITRKNLK